MQAALHQSAQYCLVRFVAVKREAGDVGLASCPAYRPVHRLDNVAPDGEITQGRLEAGLQGPLRRADLFGQPEALELGGTAEHQPAKLGIFAGAAGAKIGDPAALVGDVAERSVETGPALGVGLVFQPGADFLLAAWSQLQRDPFRRPAAKAPADVLATDDQVLAVVGAAADEHVDMGIVGVPMIDRYPVELGAEVMLGVLHELAGEGPKVRHVTGVFRRDREPKMMPVPIASFGRKPSRRQSSEAASNIRASAPSRMTPSRFR